MAGMTFLESHLQALKSAPARFSCWSLADLLAQAFESPRGSSLEPTRLFALLYITL